MAQAKSVVCDSGAEIAAEVEAAREVVVELRRLLDRFSTHLSNATRMFDETVSHAADDSWIGLCHETGVAALWIVVADFRSSLEAAVERASNPDGSL